MNCSVLNLTQLYSRKNFIHFFFSCALWIPLSIVAQAPVISYSGVAPSYSTGVAITSLTPTNSGGAITGTSAQVTTFAGSGPQGSTDATGIAASFRNPWGVAVDASGNLYVADNNNHKIRKITAAGVVTTFAGSGSVGSADGTGTAATFNHPVGIAVDVLGNVYVGDQDNNKIRKINSAGVVTTLAGSGTLVSTDGTGSSASFSHPNGVAVDASGNAQFLYKSAVLSTPTLASNPLAATGNYSSIGITSPIPSGLSAGDALISFNFKFDGNAGQGLPISTSGTGTEIGVIRFTITDETTSPNIRPYEDGTVAKMVIYDDSRTLLVSTGG